MRASSLKNSAAPKKSLGYKFKKKLKDIMGHGYTELESALGYKFKKKSLLKEAITHKSYAHERHKDRLPFNERMEFLGDSVLELIISEYIYLTFPEYTEADLSRIKAYTVQEATLAETAKTINLGPHLLLGKGEELTGGRKKPSLLADALEAVIAAIYLDGGYKKAREFIYRHLIHRISDMTEKNIIFDFKTKLQEVAQAQFGVLPSYVMHKEEGPEHKKTFEVQVFINESCFGSGAGKTKKAAAQKAAEAALKKIKKKQEHEINV